MTYNPERSTDHLARGLRRPIGILRKPKLQGLMSPHLRQRQKLESAAYEVAYSLNIESGFGVILDNIGAIVGRGREGAGDTEFKIALRAQIRINRSTGKTADFTDVGGLSVPGTTWHVDDYPPASLIVYSDEPVPSAEAVPVLFENLRQVRPLGVRAFWDWTLEDVEVQMLNTWTEATATSTEGDGHGMGWTEADTDTGGTMSALEHLK
jgi:hypothetical protein